MHSTHADAGHILRVWPDRAIAQIAARQATMISRSQLLKLGVHPRVITAALSRGRLHRVHAGVYSLLPPRARPRLAAEWAAVLATGPHAVISHQTAAPLHGIQLPGPAPRVIHVTVIGAHRRRRPGLTVHRSIVLPAEDRGHRHGLAVTSIARTVLDLAPLLDDQALEQLIDRALQKTSRAKLQETVARHRRRPGAARVAALLHPTRPSADTWSRTEARLRRMLLDADIPAPEANQPVGPYIVDLIWRQQRVIVEYDSDLHSGDIARRRDDVRHNDLASWGWNVLHVPWPVLRDHPERVIAWVAVALARAEWTAAR